MPADFEVQATQLPSDIILYKLMFWWLSKIMSAYSSSSESSVYNQGICLGQNWTALSAKAIQVLFVFFVRTAGTGKRETLCISRRMKNTIKSGVPKSFPIGRSYTIYPFGYLSGNKPVRHFLVNKIVILLHIAQGHFEIWKPATVVVCLPPSK
jgi:hypothetical protein